MSTRPCAYRRLHHVLGVDRLELSHETIEEARVVAVAVGRVVVGQITATAAQHLAHGGWRQIRQLR